MKFTSVVVVLCTLCVLHGCAADVAIGDTVRLESMKKYVDEMAQYIKQKAVDLKKALEVKQAEIGTSVKLLLELSNKFELKVNDSFTILLKQVSDKKDEITTKMKDDWIDVGQCTEKLAVFKDRVVDFKVNHRSCVDEKIKAVQALEKSMAESVSGLLSQADRLLEKFQKCVESSKGVASSEEAVACLFKIPKKYSSILKKYVDPAVKKIVVIENKASEVFSSAATCFKDDPELSSDKVRQMLVTAETCVKDTIMFDLINNY